MEKEDRTRQHEKKNKDKKFEKSGLNQDETKIIEMIEQSTAQTLYKFLDQKYQKYVNERMAPKINKAIILKLKQFKENFSKDSIKKIINIFDKCVNLKIDWQQAKLIWEYGSHRLRTIVENQQKWIKSLHLSYQTHPNKKANQYIKIYFNYQRPGLFIKAIYNGDYQHQAYYQPSYKRIQKQSMQILQKFIQLQQQIEQNQIL